MSTDLNTFPL